MTIGEIDELKRWIGVTRRRCELLCVSKAEAMAALLGLDAAPKSGDELWPGWQWMYFLDCPTADQTGVDGHARTGEFLPPVGLPRRMWAAGRLDYASPLILGGLAEQTSTVSAVDIKQGRSGRLVFVKIVHCYSQHGRLCLNEEQTLVYRDMPAGPTPLPSGDLAPALSDWTYDLQPDPVLLFRYSALTYNAHRIHYDRDYAIHQEHYPGLVVQGPLLASLLAAQAMRRSPGERPERFQFQALRPSFEGKALAMCGVQTADGMTLWTRDADGFVGMNASMTWVSKT